MLDVLRKATRTWLVKLLFILLILSFVGWGVGDMVGSGFSGGPAIKVGETAVSADQVNTEFKREIERLQPLFGGKLTAEEARKLGLLDRVIDTVVNRTLIDEAARRLGLAASDQQVLKEIGENPAFRNEAGQFDRDRLRRALYQAGLSEGQFIAMERGNLMRGQMADALSGGVAAPAALVEPLVRWREERRVAEAVEIKDQTMPLPPPPEAAVLEAFYKEHAASFMAPEFRALTALLLRPADVEGDIQISDEELDEAYKVRADEFNTPERRSVSQIVLTNQAEADKAQALIAEGKDIAAVAKALNVAAVDLGEVAKSDLPDELAEAAFAQAAGTTVGPVRSALGWHVVKVAQVTPAHTRPLAEVRAMLEADLRREKAGDVLAQLTTKVEDALGGGTTLEEAATRLNLKVVKAVAVDARGNGPDGKPVASLPKAESLLDVAFQTDQGQESPLTELDGGEGYFIVRVDAVTPPAPKPLADVRAQVVAAWQAKERNEAARKKAEQMAEKAKAGEPLAKLAQGLKPALTKPFTREGADAAPLPPQVVAELFRAQPGGIALGAGQDGWVVARLDKVIPFDPATHPKEMDAARTRVSQGVAGDLVDEYFTALRAEIGVQVDRKQFIRDE